MARWFLILLTGCSLTLSGPDPNRPRNKPPACDTSKGMVAADGVFAATLGLIAVGVASNGDGGEAVAPALLGSLFLLSAIHGNGTVDACNREMNNFASTMAAPSEGSVAQLPPRPALLPLPQQQPQQTFQPQPPAQPQPAFQPPPQPQPPPPPRQPGGNDPWTAFWQEVP